MSTEKTFDADYPQIAALGLDIDSGYCGNPVVDADDLSKALDKLRVEYAAVLARADLMDRLATGHQKEKHETQNRLADALARAEAAEDCQRETVAQSRPYILELQSRLAAATALLDEADNALTEYPEPRTESLRDRMQAFLSATPAQAAEPKMVESADGTMSYELETVPYHDADDLSQIASLTIALRECRAELESTQQVSFDRAAELEELHEELKGVNNVALLLRDGMISARAERDTALDDAATVEIEWQKAVAELTTALARIAELEQRENEANKMYTSQAARIAELQADVANCGVIVKSGNDIADAVVSVLRARIAQAVAALQEAKTIAIIRQQPSILGPVLRALEALR